MKKLWAITGFVLLGVLTNGWSADSAEPAAKVYYDPVSGQLLSEDQLARSVEQELYFSIQVGHIDLGEIILLEQGDLLWVSLKDLFDLLEFPVELNYSFDQSDQKPERLEGLQAQGWYINESNRFSMRLQGERILINSADNFVLESNQILIRENRVLVPFINALNWFDIQATTDKRQLKARLNSKQKLPIEQRLARNSQSSQAYLNQFELQYPRYDVPYRVISPVFTDVQIGASRVNDANRYNTSILGSGDLAYMTGRYYLNHRVDEATDKTYTNARLTLLRNDINSQMLGPLKASHVSVGDITPTSISNISSGGNDVGLRVSNRPYGSITNANTTNIIGQQQPGWEVELYQNGILVPTKQVDQNGEESFVNSQITGDDGRYEFLDQPLTIGENIFTLKFYGPQGQREEIVETYNLDQSALVGGKFIYDLSVSQQDTQIDYYFKDEIEPDPNKQRFNLHLEKGLGQNFSLTADYARYYFDDGVAHDFVQPGFRIYAFDTLVNAQYTQDLQAGHQYNFAIARGFGRAKDHKLSFNYRSREEDFITNSSDSTSNKTNFLARLQGPIMKSGWTRLNYLLSANDSKNYDDSNNQTYAFNLGLGLGGLLISHNYEHRISQNSFGVKNVRTQGGLQMSSRWRRIYYRVGANYTLEPEEKLQSSQFTMLWNMANAVSSEYQYSKDFSTEAETHKVGVFWTHQRFISSFNVSKLSADNYSGNINIRFSLGHDPLKNRMVMSSRSMSNYGAAAVFVYHDLNNNQQYDEGEPAVEDVQVRSPQFRSRAYTDQQGRAFIPGLYPTQPTDIEINPDTIKDPFWIPSKQGEAFLARPGLVKTIYIPLVNSGEVEGKVAVIQSIESNPVGQGRVPLVLTRISDQKTYRENTSFDGYFLFNKILPGEYLLNVDPVYLARYSLRTPPAKTVVIHPDGSVIMGANFILYPTEMVDLQPEPSYDNEVFWISLGEFSSEQNAKIVAQAMRQVFPSILSSIHSLQPYQLTLAQSSQAKFLLKLGPLSHINNAKIICGALLEEGLSCSIEKVIKDL